jgi:hypothetical protein
MKVFVSWPCSPHAWAQGVHSQNEQQAHYLLHGLRERFEQTVWLDWNTCPPAIGDDDVLVSHVSWPLGYGHSEAIREFSRRARWISIYNDPLFNYTLLGGAYDLHGYDGFDNRGLNRVAPEANSWAAQVRREIDLSHACICHANDESVRRWQARDPSLSAWLEATEGRDFTPHISPIAKEHFPRERAHSRGSHFLILSGNDVRKNQADFRRLSAGRFLEFGTANWRVPSTYRHLIEQCAFMGFPSKQEGWPYWLAEAMCKGLAPLAGEDFWAGLGHEELVWRQSADGSTDSANRVKIDWLLSDSLEVERIYQEVIAHWLVRRDNEWPAWLDLIASKIRKPKDGRPRVAFA